MSPSPSTTYTVVKIPGDGIGPEIVAATGSHDNVAGERGREPRTVWANLVQSNDKPRFEVSQPLTEALELVRAARDVSLDLKAVTNGYSKSPNEYYIFGEYAE